MIHDAERCYIICKNLTEVFRAERILQDARLPVRLVPAPPKAAGPCSTALEVSGAHKTPTVEMMNRANIEIIKIVPFNLATELLQELDFTGKGSPFGDALSKTVRGLPPALPDLQVLLRASTAEREILWKAADKVRENSVGDIVDVRAALEFSNHCRRNCHYCGLRSDNAGLARYRMTRKEIVNEAVKIRGLGIKTVILQSGEDPWYTTGEIVDIIREIKRETGMRITLSLGEREPEEYEIFKTEGANNYLLKVETTNPKIYSALHPGYAVTERIRHIRMIKKAGYITGSGNIIGLPGQDIDSIARDIIWFWQEGINMIGIGPFIPALNSPLEHYAIGSVELTLNTIAVTRLVCRNAYIPSTTALATIDPEAQLKGLACGANTVMLIMTPPGIREKYSIYSNKMAVDMNWALEMIKQLKRKKPPGMVVKKNVDNYQNSF